MSAEKLQNMRKKKTGREQSKRVGNAPERRIRVFGWVKRQERERERDERERWRSGGAWERGGEVSMVGGTRACPEGEC
eukprot:755259-Hanusia_phi.AAC.5